MKVLKFIPLVLSLVLAAWVGGTRTAEGSRAKVIVVEGESPIYDGDVVQARERALEDAFRKAVRKILGTFVSAESYTQNFISIDDSILTKAKGYIKTYEIAKEQRKGDTVTLETKVTVSVEPIKDDLTALGILIESMGNPRVVVRISEKGMTGDPVKNPVAQRRIKEILTEKGFKVLDRAHGEVDVEVLGEGVVENVSSIGATGIKGCIVRLDVKAVTGKTRDVIASESVRMNGAAPNIDAAVQTAYAKAAERAVYSLIDEVADKWSRQALNGRDITLEVSVDSYSKLQRFRKRLGYIFGVKKVQQRTFTGDSALLDAKFTGSPKTLADLINAADFRDVKVEILRFAADKLKLRVE